MALSLEGKTAIELPRIDACAFDAVRQRRPGAVQVAAFLPGTQAADLDMAGGKK
jgi:hypothetical protein